MKFRCPHCSQKIGLPTEYAGKQVKCAKCKKPFRVPQPSAAAPAAVVAEQPAVAEPPSVWDQLGGTEELRLAESSAPSVERPSEQPKTDYGTDVSGSDAAVPVSTATERPKKKRSALVVGLSFLLIVLVVAVIAWFVAGPGDSGADSAQAEELAEQFIYMLNDKRIGGAKELMTESLRSSVKDSGIQKLADRIGQGEIADLTCLSTHFEQESFVNRHYLWYSMGYGEQMLTVMITVVDEGGELGISGMATDSYTGDSVVIGASSYDEIQSKFIAEAFSGVASIFGRYACAFGIIVLSFVVIQIVSTWVIYEKAGQPGWAAIVPIYNLWVLAEVADKPGWWGLGLCFSGAIPFVGPVIQLVLWIIISVGVAKTFNRGVGFGIGLFLLPFVFYPILAFTND